MNTGSHRKPSWSRMFLLLGPESGLLANCHGWSIEAIHHFHHGKPRIFLVWMYAIWAVQCPCHFSKVNAELPRGTEPDILLNLFGNMIVFWKTEEEHLQCLYVLFSCFQEHNLRLNPTQCEFFWDEINYLAHYVSKEGLQPSKENLKAVAKFAPPQLTQKSEPFWAWWGTISDSSRSLHILHNPYTSIYLGKVPIRRTRR